MKPFLRWLVAEARDWVAGLVLIAGTIGIISVADGNWMMAVPGLVVFLAMVLWIFYRSSRTPDD